MSALTSLFLSRSCHCKW